eukprot:5587-Heterococcus_DN1.PRE.2
MDRYSRNSIPPSKQHTTPLIRASLLHAMCNHWIFNQAGKTAQTTTRTHVFRAPECVVCAAYSNSNIS